MTDKSRRAGRRRPRSTMAERAAGFLRDWSVPRQLAGSPHKTAAAESEQSRTLRPRLE